MNDYEQVPRDSSEWDNPDFCPFCGHEFSDGSPEFIDQVEADEYVFCRERFEQWRENVATVERVPSVRRHRSISSSSSGMLRYPA